jgi:hypothetical protein
VSATGRHRAGHYPADSREDVEKLAGRFVADLAAGPQASAGSSRSAPATTISTTSSAYPCRPRPMRITKPAFTHAPAAPGSLPGSAVAAK